MAKDNKSEHDSGQLLAGPKLLNRWSVIGVLALVVAIGGYLVVHFGHAAGNIPVEAAVGGVPIPTQGLYLGGIEKQAQPGATVPGCTTTAWPEMECKITWAAKQLGIDAGHLQSDGQYHSALDHYFYTGCGASAASDFKPGGRLYVAAHTPGRQVLLIDMKCGSTWKDLGNGGGNTANDAALKTFTTELDNVGLPVILSIYNEPENDICSQSNEGTPDDFRAMFRQAAADVRSQHPKNVSIALTLQGYDLAYAANKLKNNPNFFNTVFTGCSMSNLTDAERNPNNYYPGDDAVDFVTFQEYDHDKGDFADSYQNYQDFMDRACPTSFPSTNYNCTTSVRSKKPMGTSEFGISGCIPFRTTYFTNMITEIKQFPQIKYLSYWSSQDNPAFADFIDYPYQTPDPTVASHTDCGTDTTHASLKAFTQFALSPYVFKPVFSGSSTPTPTPTTTATPTPTATSTPTPTTTPTPTSTPVGGDKTKPVVNITTPANNATISGATAINLVATDNVGVTKVNLLIDGKQFATRTVGTSVVNWNSSNATNGSHTLVAMAYDAAGNVGQSSTVTVTVTGGNGDPVTVEGDVNADGKVNITDLSLLSSHWGTNYPAADFNGDGTINITDLSILLSHWTG